MRLISQDGTISLPAERVVLEVIKKTVTRHGPDEAGKYPVWWQIQAYDTGDVTDEAWILARFRSRRIAMMEFRRIHSALRDFENAFDYHKIPEDPEEVFDKE